MSRNSFWQRIPLRVQGVVFNSLPLIVVLITALFAYYSNHQRERTELSLNRHFEMVESLMDVQTALLNAEAGLRGYPLTHEASLLHPATDAHTVVSEKLSRVRTLMQAIPKENRRVEKLGRLDAIQGQVNAELDSLANLSNGNAAPAKDPVVQILQNQPQFDALLQQLSSLRESEQRLLSKRIDEIRSVRQRDYMLIFLSIFVGLVSRAVALYFFHRRVVRRVRQLTENVRSLRDGASLVHEPSGHADEIGELERELARASEFLAERRLSS